MFSRQTRHHCVGVIGLIDVRQMKEEAKLSAVSGQNEVFSYRLLAVAACPSMLLSIDLGLQNYVRTSRLH